MTQTSKLPKIKIMGATNKRSFIPLTHNVYATQKVGKITPYMCRFMDANSKAKVKLETLEYNAPMVAPTVGDVRLKHWLYFVGLDKLSPTFANMLSKMPSVGSNGTEFMVEHVPSIMLSDLTLLCLIGSYCTIYWRDLYEAPQEVPRAAWQTGLWNLFSSNNTNSNAFAAPMLAATNVAYRSSSAGQTNALTGIISSDYLGNMRAWCINAKFLKVDAPLAVQGQSSAYIPIPLSNPTTSGGSFVDWQFPLSGVDEGKEEPVYNGKHDNMTHGVDCTPVPIDHADYSVTRSFDYADESGTHHYSLRFCFRLSDFGRSLRDIIIASGNQLNVSSSKRVSFLPYLATYLAYFECQSLQLYKNWQNTAAFKIIRRFETNNVWDLSQSFAAYDTSIDRRLFVEFVNDLATMWCIEPQDFVSCHTREPITSPLVFNNLDQFINNVADGVSGSADGVPIDLNNASHGSEPQSVNGNNQPYINSINHDVVTAELLRKLYLRSSVNSVVGRKITSLLKENGFGDWVDLQKAVFIDYGEMRLDLKPVVSTADTSSEGKGADLGQYGGRGYGHKEHKPKTFTNKVGGYYVLLTTFYVDAGYCQSIDPYNYQTAPDDFYRREFDSLGYELDAKSLVHGSLTDVQDGDFGALDSALGFAPRDTKYKHMHNKLLGYFTNGELSDVYEAYHLEKLLPVGKTSFSNKTVIPNEMLQDGGQWTYYVAGARFDPSSLPIAGNIWRYLGKFPWLGRFDRIFKLQDYDVTKVRGVFGLDSENFFETVSKIYSYFVCSPENYTCLNTIWFDSWQDKKPISESFGTLSQIFEGFATAAVNKE